MAYPDLDWPLKKVTEQLPLLGTLADVFLERKLTHSVPFVVPFIGAGASVSAGLPTSSELKHRIYRRLVQDEGGGTIATVLDKEAYFLFGQRAQNGILQLSLFEFASVVSQSAHGREVIHEVLSSVLRQGRRRPLAYELLAHLAKHGFLDHFVSLNFDELLDEALSDELSDQLRFITSPDEVPGPRWLRERDHRPVFLFKPFGSLSKDTYRLRPEETHRYGSESVWRFMLTHAFRSEAGNRAPKVCLLLVGYGAAEPAFKELLDELRSEDREVTLFTIDPADTLPSSLRPFSPHHIQLPADLALDLLLQLIRVKYLERANHSVWIPVARHKVVSYCLDQDATRASDRRFNVELILQAVKSRGFFTIEAVADIHRIQKYDDHASRVIDQMCKEGILEANPWDGDGKRAFKHLQQDYRLKIHDYEDLAKYVLQISNRNPDEQILEWVVEDGQKVSVKQMTYQEFLVNRFTEIAAAPEIEVVHKVSPATRWLFRTPKPLRSVEDLTESTADLFKKAFDEAEGQIELHGIWSTGEWLFHEEGWAWPKIGKEVERRLSEGQLKMSLVLAKIPPAYGTRTERAEAVRKLLQPYIANGRCQLLELEWWRHNRTLTLLRWSARGSTQKQQGGIYMRRRLATPIVAPISVQGKDCIVLQELFTHYEWKVHGKI